jgi:serine phosphatase RsbU (regulator of sigma subunit)
MPADGSIRCLYAVFDFTRGQLEFASAGQHEAYICNGSSADTLEETGKPLGLAMDSRYQQAVAEIKPGHRLVLCNDAVVNLRNSKGLPYGSRRLMDCIAKENVEGQHITDGIMKDLRKFSGKRWNPDRDLTLLVLERIPEGQDR